MPAHGSSLLRGRPVTVNLSFSPGCEMYLAIKSLLGVGGAVPLTETAGHTDTHLDLVRDFYTLH